MPLLVYTCDMNIEQRIAQTTRDLQNSRLFQAVLERVKGIEDAARVDESYVGSLEEELRSQSFLDGGDF